MQKFKNFFKSHKTIWLFLVLVILTAVLVVTTYLHPSVFNKALFKFKEFTSQLADGSLFKEKSSAKVWTENGSLKIQFVITPEDKMAMREFNSRMGVGNDYLNGISLDLDDKSIQVLNGFLPLNLSLKVTPQSIGFSSGIVQGFASSLIKETSEVSTGSGKLKLEKYSANEFSLNITDPEPLLKQATVSGQFVMSDKLLSLFSILERVSTIEMDVNGKSVSGEIKLK